MFARLPRGEEIRTTPTVAEIAAAGQQLPQHQRQALRALCYLCGSWIGPGVEYLEDPHALDTYCHLACFMERYPTSCQQSKQLKNAGRF